MNGLNSKRLMQVLSFKCLLLCILSVCGCSSIKWTDIDLVNLSDKKIYIKVSGIYPDLFPDNMVPDSDGDGSIAGLSLGDPVHFDEVIKFEWKVNSEETQHEKEFKRDDLGIPSVVHGGKIRITYTKTGDWEIDYSR